MDTRLDIRLNGASSLQKLLTDLAAANVDLQCVAAFSAGQGRGQIYAGAETLKPLAEAGINGIAGCAMLCDGQYQILVVVSADDAKTVEKMLQT